jgi:hypothetical protein
MIFCNRSTSFGSALGSITTACFQHTRKNARLPGKSEVS